MHAHLMVSSCTQTHILHPSTHGCYFLTSFLIDHSPVKDTVITDDRWGHGDLCVNGGYYICHDHYNPGVLPHQETFIVCIGVLQKHKWEDADTIDKSSWGYQRDISIQGYHTTEDLVHLLVTVVR